MVMVAAGAAVAPGTDTLEIPLPEIREAGYPSVTLVHQRIPREEEEEPDDGGHVPAARAAAPPLAVAIPPMCVFDAD